MFSDRGNFLFSFLNWGFYFKSSLSVSTSGSHLLLGMPFSLGKRGGSSDFRLTLALTVGKTFTSLFYFIFPSVAVKSYQFCTVYDVIEKRMNYRFGTDAGRKCVVEKFAFTAIIKTLLREAEYLSKHHETE